MPKYRIWCTVSGGITGSRAAWLKSGKSDEPWETTDREAADMYASELRTSMRGGPGSTVRYTYEVRRMNDDQG